MRQQIRWGIVGCGGVCEQKSGPALRKASGSSLVAVMRRDRDRARDFAQRHGVARWYDDAGELIHAPDVDAVYIATPPGSHRDYALACAAAGKPAYVEKPMALDAEQCREMNDAFRAAGVPLFVAYYRRALPRFRRVKEIVESGQIGSVRFAQVTMHRPPSDAELRKGPVPWRLNPAVSGGGHFVDLACHTLDLLAWILGPVQDVRAIACNQAGLYPAEDTVAASFRWTCGAAGTGLWCFGAAERSDEVVLMGDTGSVRFSTFADTALRVARGGEVTEERIAHPEHIQQPLIQSIVDELLGRGRCPSSGETAMQTTVVIDRILQDWRSR
jgi:1,5-anhydro-D-fructose reductase (1,5-anhydro-D-mannitol-forming)